MITSTLLSPQFFELTNISSLFLQEELQDHLKQEYQNFQTKWHLEFESTMEASLVEVDNWISANQQTMADLFEKLTTELFSHSKYAMPAHDTRHALIKVPMRALEHYMAHYQRPSDILGVFGALCHDWGRWYEEKIYGGPTISTIHARLSYLLTKNFLKNNEVPPKVALLWLHSVINHTTGANYLDPMPLKIVVRADRDQLYGPEIIFRILHHTPMPNGLIDNMFNPNPAIPNKSIFERLCVTNKTRLQGPLYGLDASLRQLEHILESFLITIAPDIYHLNLVNSTHFDSVEEKLKYSHQLINCLPDLPLNFYPSSYIDKFFKKPYASNFYTEFNVPDVSKQRLLDVVGRYKDSVETTLFRALIDIELKMQELDTAQIEFFYNIPTHHNKKALNTLVLEHIMPFYLKKM